MRRQAFSSRWAWVLALLPAFCGFLLLVADTRPQQALRNQLFDQFQRWQPRVYVPAPVRIVDIDESSLARLGQWPWPRTRIAELLAKLGAGGTAAVGFDILFSEADRTAPQAAAAVWRLQGALRSSVLALPDHDAAFAAQLRESDAVLGFALERSAAGKPRLPAQKAGFVHLGETQTAWLHPFASAVTALEGFEAAAKGNGALSFVPDSDGVLRRVPLVFRIGDTPVASLATETLRVAQGAASIVLKAAGSDSGLAEIRIGALTLPTTPQGEVWVHYSPPVSARYLPAWQVLAGEVAPELLDGHIVLVGSSAQGLMDLRFSPFGLIPGVEAHAQAIEQALTGYSLQRPSWARGVEALAMVVGGLLVGVVALRIRALLAASICLALLATLLLASWLAFSQLSLLLDAATPMFGVALTFLTCSLWHHFASEREQRWVKAAFSRYVSPNRVKHLIDHPEDMALGGMRHECSFVFTDLEGFTALMEKIDPGEAVALLNAYLDGMIAIAFRHEGTLDRIVGDAVAIMFAAPVAQPDHRARAYACALEMNAFANRYSAGLQGRGLPFGKTRIGVHGGEVIVGNYGGSTIFDYRALGDPVNTAARLESVNKHLGTHLCVSEFILKGCADAVVRPVGRLILKGKAAAIAVFEPVVDDGLARAPLAEYNAAFEMLREASPDAPGRFAELASRYPEDPLIALHCRRLQAGEQGELIVMGEK